MGNKAVHRRVQDILPWFVNETLGGKERKMVLKHLKRCPACREERDCLQRLQQEVNNTDESLPDYRFAFRKLAARVDAAERAKVHEAPPKSAARGWLSLVGAAATVVLGVLFAGSLQQTMNNESDSEDFVALTVPSLDEGVERRISLSFEAGASDEEIRAALIAVHSRLISGPDPEGTWIVDLKVPADMSDADFIRSVRAMESVENATFYDPGDGSSR